MSANAGVNYERVYVKGKGTVLKHRLIMEQMLGRELDPGEQVHHKDRNKGNNDPGNLELCPDDQSHKDEHAYGEEELIAFLHGYVNEEGHWPTYAQCAAHLAMPHPSTFRRVFGSWRKAKEAAQFQLDIINAEWEDY